MSTPVKVEISLGEFDYGWDQFLDENDIARIIAGKIRAEVRAEVLSVMEPYREKIRTHLRARLDWVLQEALDKVDSDWDDEDFTKVLLGEKL